jgi:hypothetical protein
MYNIYAECHYAECRGALQGCFSGCHLFTFQNAKYRTAECHYAECRCASLGAYLIKFMK